MSWKNVKMNPLIARLPRESHGYPVPQFVHKPEG